MQFLRYVARNEPFVVRGGARDWPAARLWNAEFLKEQLRDHVVNVAVTPNGWVYHTFWRKHSRLMRWPSLKAGRCPNRDR